MFHHKNKVSKFIAMFSSLQWRFEVNSKLETAFIWKDDKLDKLNWEF